MREPVSRDDEIDDDVHDDVMGKSYDLMSSPWKWSAITERVDNTNIIDLEKLAFLANLHAHRRILLMLISFSLRDRASELRFELWRYTKQQSEEANHSEGLGLRLFYEVDGEVRELVPPPNDFRLPIARDIEAAVDLNRTRRRIADGLRALACRIDGQERPPREGQFQLRLGELRIDVVVLAYASALGERYFLHFQSTSDQVSESAGRLARRFFKSAEYGLCPDRR